MRIGPNSPLTSWFNRISDGDSQNQNSGDQGQPNSEKESKKDSKQNQANPETAFDFKNDIEKIERALEWFSKDAQALANGITADKDGRGPGLKVVLRDINGQVIRSLTPGEFIKLQESQVPTKVDSTRMNGKILDRKY